MFIFKKCNPYRKKNELFSGDSCLRVDRMKWAELTEN